MNASVEQRRRGINLFRIGGIQIRLDYSWFIVFALVLWSLSAGYFPQAYPDQSASIYWLAGLLATLLFFLSIVAHEVSHSLIAIRSGIDIPEITLFIFGGIARLSEEADNPKTELKIAVVGPVTSLALALCFWLGRNLLSGDQPNILVEIFGYLAWINLALAVFNLLPGFPLDGGRMFRAIMWWKTGSMMEATRVASNWGKGFAIALMIFGGLQIFLGGLIGGVWMIFIGMFLRGMAEMSYVEMTLKKAMEGTRTGDIMAREVVVAPPELSIEGLVSDYFLRYGYRGFPVAANGKVLGLVSLNNVTNIRQQDRSKTKVDQVMAPLDADMVIGPEATVEEASKRMLQTKWARLLVMHGDQLLGILTQTGLQRFLEIKKTLGVGAYGTR